MNTDGSIVHGKKVGRIAFLLGLIFTGIAGYGFYQGWESGDARPLMSWLIGIAFWMSIAIGMLFVTQIWHVFHARWPTILRRQCEHGFSAFPILFLLFIPLLLVPFLHDNPGLLWKWMNGVNELPGHGTVGEDPIFTWKQPYLNISFFTARAVGVFATFIILAGLLRKWSFDTDKTGDINNTHKARRLSSIGLFLCAGAATMGAIDWFKSLEYHWFSTMYGVWFFAASMRAALATILILSVILAARGYLKGIPQTVPPLRHRLHDAGLHRLLGLHQLLAILPGLQRQHPEETFWYNIREKNGWWPISMCLVFGHFLIPFLILLWYKTKVVVWRTVAISAWILTFHIIDLYWNILPGKIPADNAYGYTVRPFTVEIFDIAAIIGIGGFCVWGFCRSMNRAEPIPVRDPNIENSLNYIE
jgi:hypothetical protein